MAYFGPPTGGFNPRWGQDTGGPPPMAPGAGGMPFGFAPPPMMAPAFMPGMMPGMQPIMFGQPQPAPVFHFPGTPTLAHNQPSTPGYPYVAGFGVAPMPRPPQGYPQIDPQIPASNMTNSTGGAGCEPGYNYFFAPEHTKIHVLKAGSTPPWELPGNFSVPFHACHVPVSTTVGELLKGFGATNPVAKKNKVSEVVQGGNGRWYKGINFNGGDDGDMKKTLKELGWDSSRSGLPGKKPVVYLYITKD